MTNQDLIIGLVVALSPTRLKTEPILPETYYQTTDNYHTRRVPNPSYYHLLTPYSTSLCDVLLPPLQERSSETVHKMIGLQNQVNTLHDKELVTHSINI